MRLCPTGHQVSISWSQGLLLLLLLLFLLLLVYICLSIYLFLGWWFLF